jgi:hypothetical protein
VRVLVGLIIAVLLVSFASAQELRLYSVEEGVMVACKVNQLMTAEEKRKYDEDINKLGDPQSNARIWLSLSRVEGEFPFKIAELKFSESVHPIARNIVEETFRGFKFEPGGQTLVVTDACGIPTPTHAQTPYLVFQKLGRTIEAENVVPLVKGVVDGRGTIWSRGIISLTRGIIGDATMRFPLSIRTAALDMRITIESGRMKLCYQVVSNPVEAARWVWGRIIPDTAPLKIVDCTLARQTPSQPPQPSSPDR